DSISRPSPDRLLAAPRGGRVDRRRLGRRRRPPIATGSGISSWFVPTEFEERDGKPVAVKLNFGPGMESRSLVTAWDPPRRFAAEAPGWAPGSPTIADEWTVEGRAGGTRIVRAVD